jgi:hypothetical protein
MGLCGSLCSGDSSLLRGLVLPPLEHCCSCCVKDIGWEFCEFSLCLSPCRLEWLDPVRFELDLEFEL